MGNNFRYLNIFLDKEEMEDINSEILDKYFNKMFDAKKQKFVIHIEIEKGQIFNMNNKEEIDLFIKVVDNGIYQLLDKNYILQKEYKNIYVPNFLSINEEGWGDYLNFTIKENGFIKDWKFVFEDMCFNGDED